MEENKTTPDHVAGCQCYGCMGWGMNRGYGFGRRFFLFRWILGLIILAVAFCIGVKVGEFKALMRGDGGYGMREWGHRGMMRQGFYPPMMNYQMMVPNNLSTTTPVQKTK